MELHLKTDLGVMIQESGKERATKQPFSNIIEGVTAEQALELGDIVETILPDGDTVNRVIKYDQTQFTK